MSEGGGHWSLDRAELENLIKNIYENCARIAELTLPNSRPAAITSIIAARIRKVGGSIRVTAEPGGFHIINEEVDQ